MGTEAAIRVAIMGLGRMGRSHFERSARDPHFRVVAVADRIEAHRTPAVERCGCSAFADATELLARVDQQCRCLWHGRRSGADQRTGAAAARISGRREAVWRQGMPSMNCRSRA